MAHLTLTCATLLSWLSLAAAGDFTSVSTAPTQQLSTLPLVDQLTSQGCYGSLSATANKTDLKWLSSGACWEVCVKQKKDVTITHMNNCYCADTYPPEESLVDDSECNHPCPYYAPEACGGSEAYSVFNSGSNILVKNDDPDKATRTSSASTGSTSTGSASTDSASASTDSASTDSASTASSASTTGTDPSQTTSTPAPSVQTNGASYQFSMIQGLGWLSLFLAI
ncbi:hypothetical protein G7Z17_g2914 [Cylindrodendrum hubeiense]|uniref:WSC domain-containing protein n=1 Tax=Cylindrodendrum hubeiense TaxID=595255 RepID=A0A9P5LKJ1_9HYPO|nr:hypothetical protein G7Z17_g2914 [Cylindrodendrum hubeiense]